MDWVTNKNLEHYNGQIAPKGANIAEPRKKLPEQYEELKNKYVVDYRK